jgi:hypothetical protein
MMEDEKEEKKRLQIVAETTIRNRAAQGRHYPEGTAEAMVKAALDVQCATNRLANAMKSVDAMDRVLAEAEGA